MNLSFSLVICTYMRPEAILTLLKSVALQTFYPNEILVIDGSSNSETKTVINKNTFKHLKKMGISTDVMEHILDTPPEELYIFNVEELLKFNFATKIVENS